MILRLRAFGAPLRTITLFLAVLLATAAGARAQQAVVHDVTTFGDYVVEPGQLVEGNLNVVFGNVTVEGTVDGDINVVGGNVYERPGAIVTGEVHTLGGEVVNSFVPWGPAPEIRPPLHGGNVVWHLAVDVVVLLFFLVFPLRTRMALDRLERHPGLCAAVGTLGWVAVIPLGLLLFVSVILIPLILVEAIAIVAGVCIGTAALSLLVGRRLYELLNPSHTPSPLAALLIGLALLTAAELVPLLGALVLVLVLLVGLGAALLTLVGEQAFAAVGSAGHGRSPGTAIER